MIAPIQSVVIMAVEKSTSFRDILKAFTKYAIVSHISVDGFNTNGGGKYNRVYVDIERWHDTEDAYAFIKLVRNGRARLNYWWDVQDNTTRKKEIITDYEFEPAIEKEMFDKLEADIMAMLERPEQKATPDQILDAQMMDMQMQILRDILNDDDDLETYYDADEEQQVITQDELEWQELSNAIVEFCRN